MRKILLVDGIYPANTRSRRIFQTLKQENEIKFCLWNRSKVLQKPLNEELSYIYSSNEGYGNKIKKAMGIFKFYRYIKKIIKTYNPDTIIASQWDMLILCSLLKKNNQKLVYENIDMPTSKVKIVLLILQLLEKKCIKNVNGIIYASRFFKKNYKVNIKNEIVLENKPSVTLFQKKKMEYNSTKIKISFIGTLRYYEILEKLINCAKNYEAKLEILLFGNGPDEKKLKDLVKKNNQKNIIFFGEYKYEDISKFYDVSDIIWAVYPEEDYNVKYAISNKFHESIIFEKLCLFSKNTLLGEYVKNNNLGIGIDINEIDKILKQLCEDKINFNYFKNSIKEYKKENLNLFWEDEEEKLKKFIKNL